MDRVRTVFLDRNYVLESTKKVAHVLKAMWILGEVIYLQWIGPISYRLLSSSVLTHLFIFLAVSSSQSILFAQKWLTLINWGSLLVSLVPWINFNIHGTFSKKKKEKKKRGYLQYGVKDSSDSSDVLILHTMKSFHWKLLFGTQKSSFFGNTMRTFWNLYF